MTGRARRAGLVLFLLVASALALRALPAISATAGCSFSDPAQMAECQHALDLGVQAYVYGYPLLDTDRVFRTSTSINVPNGQGAGPVNTFSNVRKLENPSEKTVVAPNDDTLYSIAWLQLVPQPIVIHMPVVKHRFAITTLLDPYTTMFASIGSVGHRAGNYAVVAPHWHGRLPAGVREIRSPYMRVWIIGRTYIKDAADTKNVNRIQDEYSLTPLDKWGKAYRPPAPRHRITKEENYTLPGTQPGEDPLAFFDALGDQLKRFPSPAADRALLRQLATVGIGPGMHPSTDKRLDAATLAGLRAAIAAGAAEVKADTAQLILGSAAKHNGWAVTATGRYGTNYVLRAVVDAIGLGAPRSTVAIYPVAITDQNLQPLTGANRYVVHFSAKYLPFPVKAFWSMTMYDANGFFVPNSAGIYLVNNRSKLRYSADGSLDIYIQPNPPTSAVQRRSWLPSPAGKPFHLIMRLYVPRNPGGILSGRTWQPPTILPCDASGKTSAGVECAS
jgi:hypothetical protein